MGKAVEFTFDDPDGENLMELSNPDKALYAINAVVSHVIFSDGSSWENSENQWVPMEESDVADGGIFNPRVVEERRRQFAEKMNAI